MTKSVVLAATLIALLAAVPAGAALVITGKQIRNNSITGKDVKNRSLSGRDFRGSVRGPAGPQGPQGPAGVSRVTEVQRTGTLSPGQSTVDAFGAGNFRAQCPAGSTVVGTGFNVSVSHVGFVAKFGSFAGAYMYNDSGIAHGVSVQAICAYGPSDGAAAAAVRRRAARTAFIAAERRAQTAAKG
jgi:hypothetical protein